MLATLIETFNLVAAIIMASLVNTSLVALAIPGTIEFRSGNKTYVIRDKGVFTEAQKILQPINAVSQQPLDGDQVR